jgi:uncharacterized protein YdhG (YjbR/CyaY superfamily)
MSTTPKVKSVDDYIASASPEVRVILEQVRRVVRAVVPSAEETISYQMPALKLEKVFFSFAAFKNHIGIFPHVKGDRKLQTDLRPYRGEKGNLNFPLSEPIPYELIGRVVSALSLERSS